MDFVKGRRRFRPSNQHHPHCGDGAKAKLSIIQHSGVQRHRQSRRAARFYHVLAAGL